MDAARGSVKISAPFRTLGHAERELADVGKPLLRHGLFGGPDRDRTDDLFHAIRDNTCGINDILRNLGEQKGTLRALRSRKSAPVVPSFSIHLS
jgi:hypothetical protein